MCLQKQNDLFGEVSTNTVQKTDFLQEIEGKNSVSNTLFLKV